MASDAADLRAEWLAAEIAGKSSRKKYWRSALSACGEKTPVLLFGDSIFSGEVEFQRCTGGVPAVFLPVVFPEVGLNRLFEASGKPLFALHAGSPDDGDAVEALFDLIGEREEIRFVIQDSGPRPLTVQTLSALVAMRLGRLTDLSARGLVLTSATSSAVAARFDWSRPISDDRQSANDAVMSVARERDVPCLDFARLMRELGNEFGDAALFQADGVHLSLAGRLVLIGAVFRGLTGDMPALERLAAELAEGWSQARTDEALSATELSGFARRAAQMIGAMG